MTAESWIRAANTRPIGRVEMRDVVLDIGAPGGRRLRLRTLREVDGDVARTLFCVLEPRPFRNLNYVAVEERGRLEPFRITLYLPFALGTLRELPPERRREGHLGSDFAYEDLRTWLYEEGHEYELRHEGDDVHIRGRCVDRQQLVRHGNAPFEVIVDAESAFVRGIDYLSPGGARTVRSYRADDITRIDGVLIPRRMTMTDHVQRHSTTIELQSAWYDRPIESGIFEPAFRKRSFDYLRAL